MPARRLKLNSLASIQITHVRTHTRTYTTLHISHHVTPNHNPRAWTSNEANLKKIKIKKSSGVINAFSYANVINAKLQSHYANRLFLEPLYKYSQLKSGISLAIFLFFFFFISFSLYLSFSLGAEIIRK